MKKESLQTGADMRLRAFMWVVFLAGLMTGAMVWVGIEALIHISAAGTADDTPSPFAQHRLEVLS